MIEEVRFMNIAHLLFAPVLFLISLLIMYLFVISLGGRLFSRNVFLGIRQLLVFVEFELALWPESKASMYHINLKYLKKTKTKPNKQKTRSKLRDDIASFLSIMLR